ncbi:MAG TPA: biopolymer transporter Tol [Methylomirabilota bacterium]|nr:biopolymer transporter Tol [Methylomirabilota bacterium]
MVSPVASGAQPERIPLVRETDSLGFTKPIPVHVSGFSGEVDGVLKQDLFFMGIQHGALEEAKFLIKGSNAGRVEGHLYDKINNQHLFGRAYAAATLRAGAHAFADDIARLLIPGVPPIAQTKMAFKAEAGIGKSEVYIADYDGANAQRATQDGSIVAQPAWAGRSMLFYTSYRLGPPVIFSHHLTTGSRVAVARHPGANISPAVSPDATKLAMILSKNGSPDLYVSELNGSNLKQLTFTRTDESSPCWSPDGRNICYVSSERGTPALYVISASGGSARRLATIGAPRATEPDWSPDGRWIAFTSQTGGFQICIVPAEGGNVVVLAEGEDPSWAPNSRALLFCRGRDHAKRLSLLDVPSRQVKDVARVLESNSQPSWAK